MPRHGQAPLNWTNLCPRLRQNLRQQKVKIHGRNLSVRSDVSHVFDGVVFPSEHTLTGFSPSFQQLAFSEWKILLSSVFARQNAAVTLAADRSNMQNKKQQQKDDVFHKNKRLPGKHRDTAKPSGQNDITSEHRESHFCSAARLKFLRTTLE